MRHSALIFLSRSAALRDGLPAVWKDFFFLLPSTYASARDARLGDVLGYPLVAPNGAWTMGAIASQKTGYEISSCRMRFRLPSRKPAVGKQINAVGRG